MAKRPKQEEIPLEGKGVAPVTDKKLTKLGEDFIDKRDAKATLAEELTGLETKIKDRMAEIGVEVYRFGDQEMRIKLGKAHIKVKTIKNEGAEEQFDGTD
jgi:hypothetical protein